MPSEAGSHLLPDVLRRRGEKLDEDGNSSMVNDDAGVLRGARSDVRERPGGLELHNGGEGERSAVGARRRGGAPGAERGSRLKLRQVVALQELHEAGHNARPDDLLDGRRALCGAE